MTRLVPALLPILYPHVAPLKPTAPEAMEKNSLPQGIFPFRRRKLPDLSIRDRDLREFPCAGNRETGSPEQRFSDPEQGINTAHCRASSRIDRRTVCDAIAAIFAAFY
jgi:hypothetical protein